VFQVFFFEQRHPVDSATIPQVHGGSRRSIAIRGGRMAEATGKEEPARRQMPVRTAGPLSIRTLTPRVGPHSGERRNVVKREELLRRITAEYLEMPGLRLTALQAQRLFGLRDDVCARVLHALVDAAILRRNLNGTYARHGLGV
jgi:hypothetical protein